MFSNKVKEIAAQIGNFFLVKNKNDYVITQKEIESLRISNITVSDNSVTIELGRPGLLIGPRGRQISDLQRYLGLEILIIEKETIVDYLVPINYSYDSELL